MKKKIYALFCILCLVFSLSSCSLIVGAGIENAMINENGELVLIYDNGKEQNLGVVVGASGENGKDGAAGKDGTDGADGSLLITANGSSIPAASAKGLRSAVSIVCNFEVTVTQGGWRPGSGSTTTKNSSSAGSGLIYSLDRSSGDAFIVTNYHVVYDASSNTENGISNDISVYLYGSEIESKAMRAEYVGGSLYYDLALLRIEDSEVLRTSDACSVDIADSDSITVGDSAIAIGNAQGLGISSTSGIVSVDSEHITMLASDGKTAVSFRVMRVDTAINSGNSGGGLYNDEGNLIGIVNAKFVYDGVENIGYAIPSNIVDSVARNIIDYCYGNESERVQKAMLGITVSASDSNAIYDPETGLISVEETVILYEVASGSLADGLLMANDVIESVSVNGVKKEITRQYQLIDLTLDVRPGDVLTVELIRDGTEMNIEIEITEESLTAY